jgi:Ni/Co efflux regulator RcnB
MMKISAKRMLLAAAAASSLAAVMAPQAASAAEVQCRGRQECQTRDLRVGKDRTVYYRATAQEQGHHGDRARGKFEVRNAHNGYRVKDGRFFGSTYGRVDVRPYNAYNLKVESDRRAVVTGRLWS